MALSSLMITKATGALLDESQITLTRLKGAVKLGKRTLGRITKAKQVLEVSGSLIVLAGAIVSQNPGAIFKSAEAVFSISKDLLDEV